MDREGYGKDTSFVRKEMQKLSLKLNKCKEKREKIQIYNEFKQLRKDLK